MKQYETRSPLQQPEGHEGVQVNFYNDEALTTAEIVTRNPQAYLAVSFVGEKHFSDSIQEDELFLSLPRLQIGWQTSLYQKPFIEKMKEIFADREIDDFWWQWMQDDEPATYSKKEEDLFRHEREQVSIHFKPRDTVSWQNRPGRGVPQVLFTTLDSFDMVRGTITQLIQETAAPEHLGSILASMDPFKTFYRQYVEIDFDNPADGS